MVWQALLGVDAFKAAHNTFEYGKHVEDILRLRDARAVAMETHNDIMRERCVNYRADGW